jgi:hypothetical protein
VSHQVNAIVEPVAALKELHSIVIYGQKNGICSQAGAVKQRAAAF